MVPSSLPPRPRDLAPAGAAAVLPVGNGGLLNAVKRPFQFSEVKSSPFAAALRKARFPEARDVPGVKCSKVQLLSFGNGLKAEQKGNLWRRPSLSGRRRSCPPLLIDSSLGRGKERPAVTRRAARRDRRPFSPRRGGRCAIEGGIKSKNTPPTRPAGRAWILKRRTNLNQATYLMYGRAKRRPGTAAASAPAGNGVGNVPFEPSGGKQRGGVKK